MPGQPGAEIEIKIPKIKERYDQTIYETMQGIKKLRKENIDRILGKNIPAWKKWIMKKEWKIGKLFGYKIMIEEAQPMKGEMSREKITLMCRDKELESIIFFVKQDDWFNIYGMLPRAPDTGETPGYIG